MLTPVSARFRQGLFVGGESVARSRDVLRSAGITHVVNCVGFLYPAYFAPELQYKTLFLQGARWVVLGARHICPRNSALSWLSCTALHWACACVTDVK